MPELPDKIMRIDILRVEHAMRKLCTCRTPHYEVDLQNDFVYCTDCGAIVDPFEALVKLANQYARIGDQVEALLNQRREIENYKPQLVVIKKLEKKYRKQKYTMIPTCPLCQKSFDLADLLNTPWINKLYIKEDQ